MAKKKTAPRSGKSTSRKTSKTSSAPAWRILSGLLVILIAAADVSYCIRNGTAHRLGAGLALIWILAICISVRLLIRTSRLSIVKAALICLSGVCVVDTWLYVCGLLLQDGAMATVLSGDVGARIGRWLIEGASMKRAFLTVTLTLDVWAVLATMKAWTSLYRYMVNKPYIREIVMEVSPEKPKAAPEPKRPKTVRAVEDDYEEDDEEEEESRRKAPATKPARREFGDDELPKYEMPSPGILKDHSEDVHDVPKAEIARNIDVIRTTLSDHHVSVLDIRAVPGPTVTLYKIYPDRGVGVGTIMNKSKDLSVALKVDGVRAEILKDSVGIEVPNDRRSMVPVKTLVTSDEFRRSDAELPIPIGYTVDRKVRVFDLTKTPHLLVAGATQQGKSVGLNVMISSLLFAKHPSELQFVFVDPKGNEFNSYKHLYRHYLAVLPGAEGEKDEMEGSICVKPKEADRVLRSLCAEMTERYDLMREAGSTPNIKTYNEKYKAHHLNPKNGHRFLPYIVAVIDEYADLTMSGSFTPEGRATARNIMTSLILLASKGRAAGIHVIIATQTPRKDVISGVIKANFPTQIAFRVGNGVDSKVILDCTGAEKLLGNGDMLYSQGARVERIQCGYIGPDEITALAKAVESQKGFQKAFSTPYYLPEVKDEEEGQEGGGGTVDMKKLDGKFEEAARFVVETQKASTSYLQTNLGMGFAKSARVMQQLEAAGIVGHQDGAKPREVLVKDFAELQPILDAFMKK